MSAELPTEEDVLAALVLAKAFDPPMLVHGVPGIVVEIAYQRHRAAGKSWSAAIADSERRLAIEQARSEVLAEARRHARIYRAFGDREDAIGQAVWDLERAEAEVSRHGG